MKNLKQHTIVLLAGLLILGCNPPAATTSPEPGTASSANATTTNTVKRQDVVGYTFFDAKMVVPDTAQATAFSPFDTPVEAVPTSLGKYVEHGQTIVKLTIPGADEATNAAKANATTAKATLSHEKSDASEPVKQAQQALDDARAAEKAARDTVASGGTADVDAATQTRMQAEAALSTAKQQLNQTLQPTKDAVAQSTAALRAVRADAQKGIVRAPISGTIVTLDAKPGMEAKSNQSLATIINFAAVRIQATVPADLKEQVKVGSPVIIAMNGASSAPLEGRVVSVTVSPPSQGQSSQGYLAVIRFENPRDLVQPGTSVKRVGVKTGTVQGALVVPVGAVTTKDGKSIVKVKNGSDWIDTPVETGLSDGVVIEIKSGVNEGAVVQVATAPAS